MPLPSWSTLSTRDPFCLPQPWSPAPSALEQKMTPLQKELQETLKGLLGSADKGSFMVATQYGWVLGEDLSSPSFPTVPSGHPS